MSQQVKLLSITVLGVVETTPTVCPQHLQLVDVATDPRELKRIVRKYLREQQLVERAHLEKSYLSW